MGHIHVLDDAVINKIAAGEVVERPASVVKEIVENAIDAGALSIAVRLKSGGTTSIVVTDDGRGMDRDDAYLALKRHATSKIAEADDLFAIRTMGFRGEALASIASVSRFSLATIERGRDTGLRLETAGDGHVTERPWAGPSGTTIAVEDLFYNVPARAKFLKAPATELSFCLELMQAFALGYPHIAFSLSHNDKEQFRAPAVATDTQIPLGEEVLRARAKVIFGKEAAALLYITATSRYGDLEALFSPPGVERATSKHMLTYVNGRWVKDKTLRYGILRGYHSHLLKGRFPLGVCHLRLDPSLVDVNAHPAKTEVRFQYPNEVQNLIALAIRDRLRSGVWAKAPDPTFGNDQALIWAEAELPSDGERGFLPDAEQGPAGEEPDALRPSQGSPLTSDGRGRSAGSPWNSASGSGAGSTSFRSASASTSRSWAPSPPVSITTRHFDAQPLSPGAAPMMMESVGSHGQEPIEEPVPWDQLTYIGSFSRCFLLFEGQGRLLVVDQHAFHERILFERLARDEALLSQSQPLLVPEGIDMAPSDVATLMTHQDALLKRGFEISAVGPSTLEVKAVPSILAGRDLGSLFDDLARGLANEPGGSEPGDSNAELGRLVLAKAACHAAVRSGEDLPPHDVALLLREASTVDFVHNCPHGRRVFKWWTRGQVATWFDR